MRRLVFLNSIRARVRLVSALLVRFDAEGLTVVVGRLVSFNSEDFLFISIETAGLPSWFYCKGRRRRRQRRWRTEKRSKTGSKVLSVSKEEQKMKVV